MLVAIIIAGIFGNGYQMQKKYDYCKSIEFKGKYCELQKKMSKYSKKK
jgi:hypothetical protein